MARKKPLRRYQGEDDRTNEVTEQLIQKYPGYGQGAGGIDVVKRTAEHMINSGAADAKY